jgi:hypothetical protein
MILTGWAAVARAADIAAKEPNAPDPWEPCAKLLEELDKFLDDPITDFYGVGGEMSPLVINNHVKRHHCNGMGES